MLLVFLYYYLNKILDFSLPNKTIKLGIKTLS